MGTAINNRTNELFECVEAMLDFYRYAMKDGAPAFRSAPHVMNILVEVCAESLYSATQACEEEESIKIADVVTQIPRATAR